MADPVDTDALRAMAAAGDYNMGPFAVAAADEVDRLRAVIEHAPHDEPRDGDDGYGCQININGACTCWKSTA